VRLGTPEKNRSGLVRETFRHAAIYSGASVLGRLISFFMLPFYAHILRDIGYGIMGMIDTGLIFLSSLFAYSSQLTVLRIYHDEPDVGRKPLAATTGTALVAGVMLPLILAAAACSRPLSSVMLGSPDYWHLLCLALASFWVDAIGQTAQTILVIQRRSVIYSLIGLMRLILGISLNIVLVVVLRWDLVGIFLSGLIVAVVTASVSVALLIRICGHGFDAAIARRLLAFQLPLIPGNMAQVISRQIERVLVRFQLSLSSLGVLEMAYKFPVLLNLLVVGPFMRSWSTQRLEMADEPGSPERIGRVFTYFLYLCLLGGLLLAVNIRPVLQLLTPPEFWGASRIARIDTLQVIVHGVGLHLSFGLPYAKRTGTMARLAMATSALKVGLSYVMISVWGLYGAAWAGLVTATVHAGWGYILARPHYRVVLEGRKLALIVGWAIVLFLIINGISTEAIAARGAPLMSRIQDALVGLQETWLGQWKDGKVLRILSERGDLALDLVVRTLLVGLYLAIMPLVHVETQRKLMRRLARPGRRP